MKNNNVLKTAPAKTTFPISLRDIYDPPEQLFLKGELLDDLPNQKVLAVVGSRKVSPYGRDVTVTLVRELARSGVVIVSGLAYGVDSLAHQAALDVGGRTVAVLPSGLDKIYPSAHAQLAKKIIEQGGTLVTEYPDNTEPFKMNFVARNRLIAGLASGTLITEAAERSGSLHTANFAIDQGKTVLAVPGSITSPTSMGANQLIKNGAVVVTEAKDVFLAMDWPTVDEKRENIAHSEEEQVIIELLGGGIQDADELLVASTLSTPVFNQTLTMLEIHGHIVSLGNGSWRLR